MTRDIIEGQQTAALAAELDLAEAKAWESLARYKFQMFGYWAGLWVHLNRIGDFKRPNPWRELVYFARDKGYCPTAGRYRKTA